MEFVSPAREASAEIEAKRSRFIGTAAPTFTVEEAEELVAAVRRKYPDATHNVYAYSIGTGTPTERLSDDGEPRGTAGYPVLEVIKKRGLRNVCCVVTRYFGGTLLGAGGLLRAYGKAASVALDAAGTARYLYHQIASWTLDYDQYGRVQRELEARGIRIVDTSYREQVTVRAYVTPEEVDALSSRVRDLTAGKARLSIEEGKYIQWST
ncbi:MAG: YigZ family protein [Bacillota bacterium]